jgi:ACS family tartrate transporter-like MFS transporter
MIDAELPERADANAKVQIDNEFIGMSAQRKASLRLLPVIGIGYCLAYMDRVNVSFASLRMNGDLHFSATVYGLGAGLFFIGYGFCEVPSNLLLLRFGARRWLARIMFTWGLLAAAMMFVKTPHEFYIARFCLGVAEAGFFPGVLYYLTLWFPSRIRARAIGQFFVALPLSSVVMGSLAGWLMGLDGRLGLSGWQWLFLAEGVPSALFSFVILCTLPDGPSRATWLSAEEKSWLTRTLAADSAGAQLDHRVGVMRTLLEPNVWLFGIFFFSVLTCNYAYTFSAPALYKAATGWSVARVGWTVAAAGGIGAASMLLGGAHSDSRRERTMHCIVPCCVMGVGFVVASYTPPGWFLVVTLWVCFGAWNSMQAPALAIPTEFLSGRAAATGIAAINTIAIFSGFVGPYWMGRMKDATGSYSAGLRGLIVPSLIGAMAIAVLTIRLTRQRRARTMDAKSQVEMTEEGGAISSPSRWKNTDHSHGKSSPYSLDTNPSSICLQENNPASGFRSEVKERNHARWLH